MQTIKKNIFNNNMKSIQYMFCVEENILKIYNMTKSYIEIFFNLLMKQTYDCFGTIFKKIFN